MHSDILPVLQEILLTLVEIKIAIHKYDPSRDQREEWLTAQQAMEFLYIEERTFYRRKQSESWITKKCGRKLLYLKSSLIQSEI